MIICILGLGIYILNIILTKKCFGKYNTISSYHDHSDQIIYIKSKIT